MTPKRIYKKTPVLYGEEPDKTVFTVKEPSPIDGGKIRHKAEYGVLEMRHGGWDTADPKIGYFPTNRSGDPQLFVGVPSKITELFKTKGMTKRSAAHLLALASQEAKKHGTGKLTYGESLSEYSAPMVLNALHRGDVEENPDFDELDIEHLMDQHADVDRSNPEIIRAYASVRETNDASTVRAYEHYTDEYCEDVESLPENAGELALKESRLERARRNASKELPSFEPGNSAPTADQGNLWDHASSDDKDSWTRLENFSQARSSHLLHD